MTAAKARRTRAWLTKFEAEARALSYAVPPDGLDPAMMKVYKLSLDSMAEDLRVQLGEYHKSRKEHKKP